MENYNIEVSSLAEAISKINCEEILSIVITKKTNSETLWETILKLRNDNGDIYELKVVKIHTGSITITPCPELSIISDFFLDKDKEEEITFKFQALADSDGITYTLTDITPRTEMTQKEIEEELGYKIKIME